MGAGRAWPRAADAAFLRLARLHLNACEGDLVLVKIDRLVAPDRERARAAGRNGAGIRYASTRRRLRETPIEGLRLAGTSEGDAPRLVRADATTVWRRRIARQSRRQRHMPALAQPLPPTRQLPVHMLGSLHCADCGFQRRLRSLRAGGRGSCSRDHRQARHGGLPQRPSGVATVDHICWGWARWHWRMPALE